MRLQICYFHAMTDTFVCCNRTLVPLVPLLVAADTMLLLLLHLARALARLDDRVKEAHSLISLKGDKDKERPIRENVEKRKRSQDRDEIVIVACVCFPLCALVLVYKQHASSCLTSNRERNPFDFLYKHLLLQ
jgi:hypothetical protein